MFTTVGSRDEQRHLPRRIAAVSGGSRINAGSHVTLSLARRNRVSWSPLRTGYSFGVAALLIVFGCNGLQNAEAEGDTRTLSFHHIHTNEDLTITYKVNGRYDDEALKKINWIMRDWRKNQSIAMDPHTIDILWDVHREVSAKEPIWIICGYRSPDTNAMLRRRSNGVAKFSQHMLGKAVDFYIPGAPLDQLREAGLRAQRGGVGFYPTSGSPFVHMDTGSVRHWPRMPEAQLARVLAKGPLPHGGSDRTTQVAALSNPIGPISKLMGFGTQPSAALNRAPAVASNGETAQTIAAAESNTIKPVVVAAAVPLPRVKPVAKPLPVTYEVASVTSKPVQLPPARTASLVAAPATPPSAMSPNSIINERGFWQGLPEANAPQTIPAARTAAPARRPAATQVASAEPVTTASLAPWPLPERIERVATAGALAYAPTTEPAASRTLASATPTTYVAPIAEPDTTVAVKRSGNRPSSVSTGPAAVAGNLKPGTRFNEPWMRAMIVSPSAQDFMSTSLLGTPDYRNLSAFLQKPTASVMMTFTDDPHLGMTPDRFSGSAVVFVSTVTFNQRTASLR
jgi:uncharacterized protein YcbK (DUF882 family)